MTPQEIFVGRLRRHRERNRISLEDISRDTRIKRDLLEAFERNDPTAWPRGLYARAYMRAYCSAIGVDTIDTVEEFCRLYPQGDRRVQATIQESASIVASPSEYRDEFKHASEVDRRASGAMRVESPRINMLPKPRWRDALGQFRRVLTSSRAAAVFRFR
jgi:hypothetical protein